MHSQRQPDDCTRGLPVGFAGGEGRGGGGWGGRNGANTRNDDDDRTRGLLVGFAGGGGNGACICNDDEITARAVCRLVLVKERGEGVLHALVTTTTECAACLSYSAQ